MKKLDEMIKDQMNLVKWMNESTTREDRYFYKRSIDEVENAIEIARKKLGLK